MEGFRFTPEALEYEQKKQERLLEEAKYGFELRPEKAVEMLENMDEYAAGLKDLLKEKQKALKKEKVSKKSSELLAEIEEIEEQISDLGEFVEEGQEAGSKIFAK